MTDGQAILVAPRLPAAAGDLSAGVIDALHGHPGDRSLVLPRVLGEDPLADDDLHLALYVLYELHYRGFAEADSEWEWDLELLSFRSRLEAAFLGALEESVPVGESADPQDMDLQIRAVLDEDQGPSLSRFIEAIATVDQVREFVMHRSAYQLKEADPHSWAIPRLSGSPKAALVSIQADEYGEGSAERMHAALFAQTMRELGLDDGYGAYLDHLPGVTLATVNVMSYFGLHRRWRGAVVGHLAAFEMSSSLPNRRYSNGLLRLGCSSSARAFYDVHVVADAVHENLATVDLAGGLARQEPAIASDILFGVRCLVSLDASFAEYLLESWKNARSSLRAAPSGLL